MTFYGFDKVTGRACFTASGPIAAMADYIIVSDEKDYDISTVELKDGVIVQREITDAELIEIARASRDNMMNEATRKVQILQDVVEFSEGDAQADAVAELNLWRAYRAELYRLEITANTVWPTAPNASPK